MRKCLSSFVAYFTLLTLILSSQSVRGQLPDMRSLYSLASTSSIEYTYELDQTLQANPPTQTTSNYYHQISGEEGIQLRLYKLSIPDSALFEAAEAHFQAKEYNTALDKYLQIVKNHDDFAVAMVYAGQCYSIQGNHEKAKKWYLRAVSTNYLDWMAHWFLAEAYRSLHDLEAAVKEISIAHTINRNHTDIYYSLKSIYEDAGLSHIEWSFDPIFELEEPAKINASDSIWMSYGLGKAYWKNDSIFNKENGGTSSPFFMKKELHCIDILLEAYAVHAKKKKDKKMELDYLKVLRETEHAESFVLMEIWLRQYPIMAYSLTKEELERLASYYTLSHTLKAKEVSQSIPIFKG